MTAKEFNWFLIGTAGVIGVLSAAGVIAMALTK